MSPFICVDQIYMRVPCYDRIGFLEYPRTFTYGILTRVHCLNSVYSGLLYEVKDRTRRGVVWLQLHRRRVVHGAAGRRLATADPPPSLRTRHGSAAVG